MPRLGWAPLVTLQGRSAPVHGFSYNLSSRIPLWGRETSPCVGEIAKEGDLGATTISSAAPPSDTGWQRVWLPPEGEILAVLRQSNHC